MALLKLSKFLIKQRRWQSPSFPPEKGNVSISWLACRGELSGPHHILAVKRILLFFPIPFIYLFIFPRAGVEIEKLCFPCYSPAN